VVCLVSQIRRMLGQYQPLSTYHLPSAPIPNLPVSVAEKAESLSSPPPFGGNEKCTVSFFFRDSSTFVNASKLYVSFSPLPLQKRLRLRKSRAGQKNDLRDPIHREAIPNRLSPTWKRHRSAPTDTGPEDGFDRSSGNKL
jgi:hypothetical protein